MCRVSAKAGRPVVSVGTESRPNAGRHAVGRDFCEESPGHRSGSASPPGPRGRVRGHHMLATARHSGRTQAFAVTRKSLRFNDHPPRSTPRKPNGFPGGAGSNPAVPMFVEKLCEDETGGRAIGGPFFVGYRCNGRRGEGIAGERPAARFEVAAAGESRVPSDRIASGASLDSCIARMIDIAPGVGHKIARDAWLADRASLLAWRRMRAGCPTGSGEPAERGNPCRPRSASPTWFVRPRPPGSGGCHGERPQQFRRMHTTGREHSSRAAMPPLGRKSCPRMRLPADTCIDSNG